MHRWNPDPAAVTFGIEIECAVPYRAIQTRGLPFGGYHVPAEILSEGPGQGFFTQSDSSIPHRACHRGIEFTSPVLQGEAGLRRAMAFGEWLTAMNVKPAGAGFHVHIGLDSLLGDDANDPAAVEELLRRLVNLVGQHEEALLASTGTAARRGNPYCKSMKTRHRPKSAKLHKAQAAAGTPTPPSCASDRYHVLNVSRCYRSGARTVEFRVWASTTNPMKIAAYVQMALALCLKACQENAERVDWSQAAYTNGRYKTCPQAWKEVRRFIKYAGWMPSGKHLGWLLPYEEFASPIFAELKRLAYQYAEQIGQIAPQAVTA